MPLQLLLNAPLAQPGVMKNLVLDGVKPVTPVDSVSADVFFRWEDEPTMEPQFLGTSAAGFSLVVPFEMKGRAIRLYAVSRTDAGRSSVQDIKEAVQAVFTPGGVAVLADLVFSAGTVTGTVANNGGTGTIRVLRRIGSGDYVEVDSITPATTTFTDSPAIDATYEYLLTQDGLDGTSNTLSVVVGGVSGGAGTAPDTLVGAWDSVSSVDLTWVNHGGTGDNIIERKTGFGSSGTYFGIDSTLSSATSYSDTVVGSATNVVYYYRIRNESAPGYSNVISVYIPAA